MKTLPLVSVIIPCYNQGLYIEETLNSVFSQTYNNIEIIVINDGSDDLLTTDKLFKLSSDSRIKILHIENKGVSAARNFAINISLGDYIFPLDADDLISETYIEKALSILEEDKSIDLVYCRAVYFGERSGEIDLGDYDLKSMLCRNQIINSVLLRKNKIIAIDGYERSRQREVEQAIRRLTLGDDPKLVIDRLSRSLTNKLLHAPSHALNNLGEGSRDELAQLLSGRARAGDRS